MMTYGLGMSMNIEFCLFEWSKGDLNAQYRISSPFLCIHQGFLPPFPGGKGEHFESFAFLTLHTKDHPYFSFLGEKKSSKRNAPAANIHPVARCLHPPIR